MGNKGTSWLVVTTSRQDHRSVSSALTLFTSYWKPDTSKPHRLKQQTMNVRGNQAANVPESTYLRSAKCRSPTIVKTRVITIVCNKQDTSHSITMAVLVHSSVLLLLATLFNTNKRLTPHILSSHASVNACVQGAQATVCVLGIQVSPNNTDYSHGYIFSETTIDVPAKRW